MASRRIEFVIAENPPKRLDKAVSRDVPEEATLSRTRLARLIEAGQLEVDGKIVTDAKARVEEGATISIIVEEAEDSHIGPEDIPLEVIFEDDDLIVINKPAGMVVHPAPGTPSGTLVNALLHHCGDNLSGVGGVKRPGIVHRIDKETSGLLVVAKSDAAHQGLAAQFEKHTVERYYRAVCYGVPDGNDPRLRGVKGASFEPGNILKLTTQLARHKTDRQKQAVLFQGGAPCNHPGPYRRQLWHATGCCADRMLAGNRPHPSDPCAYGPCRSRACRGSGLWRQTQTGRQGAVHRSGRSGAGLSSSGAPCGCLGVCAPGQRRRHAV